MTNKILNKYDIDAYGTNNHINGNRNVVFGKVYLYYKNDMLEGVKRMVEKEKDETNKTIFKNLEELITYVAVSEEGIYYVGNDNAGVDGVRRRKTKSFIAKKVTEIVRELGENVLVGCDSLGKYCSKRQINKLIKFHADKSKKMPCYYAIILHVIFCHIKLDKVISYKVKEKNKNRLKKMDEDEENRFREKEKKEYIDKMKGTLWFLRQINEAFDNNVRAVEGKIEHYAFLNIENLIKYYSKGRERVCFVSPYTEYCPLPGLRRP